MTPAPRRAGLLLLLACSSAAPALGAPTCQNRQGDVVRCDARDAMPVGWTVSPEAFTARVLARTPAGDNREYIALAVVLGCFFSLIALLPRFDGSQDGDWERAPDRQPPRALPTE